MIFKNAVRERLVPEPEKNDYNLQILALLILLCHQNFCKDWKNHHSSKGDLTIVPLDDHVKIEKRW